MSIKSKKFTKGIITKPTTIAASEDGEQRTDSVSNEQKIYLDGAERTVVTEDQDQTLSNKAIDSVNNTITIDADEATVENLETDNLKAGVLETDLNNAVTDTNIASAAAIKTYVAQEIATKDEASEIAYDNTISGLSATTTQGAIDEVEGRVDTAESNITTNSTNLTNHLNDATDAHDSSAISYDNSTSGLTATDAQGAIDEVEGRLDTAESNITTAQSTADNHIADATEAHTASAISNTPSGNLAATDVQAALNELQTDVDTRALDSDLTAHLNDATDAHDASAISNVPSGNLAATDVQAALNELQSDIDTRALDSDLTTHENATTGVHGVTGDIVGTSDTQTLTNKTLSGLASNSLEIQFPDRLDVKQGTTNDLEIYATSATDGQVVYDIDQKKYFGIVDNALVALGGGLGSPQTVAVVTADDAQNASDFSGLNSDIVTGGGTFGGTLTQSETASDLLTGVTKVFKYVAGATSQFDFFGYDLAIPQGFAGRTLAVELTYRTDATYSNGDFSVEILSNNGVTTSYLNNKVNLLDSKVSADGNGETVRYLVNVPADCETLKVAFQNLSATSGIEFYVDKISLDIDDFNYKDVGYTTEWVDSGPIVVEATTTDPTKPTVVDVDIVRWRRVGDSMELNMTYYSDSQAGAATGSGDYLFNLPTGYEMDASKLNFDTSVDGLSGYVVLGTKVGTAHFSDSVNSFEGIVYPYDTTRLKISGAFVSPAGQGRGTISSAMYALTAADSFNIKATVPIKGWQATSKHVVVDSGEADTEYFYVNYQSNFWDLTTSTDEWDHSLMRDSSGAADPSASSSNFFTISDVSGQTRITAKDRITLNVSVTSSMDLNGSVRIHNSNGDILQQAQADASGGYKRTTAAEVTLESGDYLYIENTDPFSDRAGSVTITAQKAQRGEYHLVPVTDQENVFSARIANNGTATVTSESSSFIDSVTRSSTGRVDIVFKSGIFTEIPSITATISDLDGSLSSASASSVTSTGCRIFTEVSSSAADRDFHIVVQKQGADYNEPKAFIGDVPLNYTQTKLMTMDTTGVADIPSLQFNNLVVGRVYEITGQMYSAFSNNTVEIKFYSASGGTGTVYGRVTHSDNGTQTTRSAVAVKFTAVSSTLYVRSTGTGTVFGNDNKEETFIQLTELNHTQETTRF